MVQERKRIVVLGAGHAGSDCANAIEKTIGSKAELIVIDRKTHSLNKMGGARGAAKGHRFAGRLLIPNDKLVPSKLGKVIHEDILAVDEKSVTLGSGEKVAFDYLVCATGAQNFSVCEPPASLKTHDEMLDFYSAVGHNIAEAKNILIVGGGPVGVELACEIMEEYGKGSKTVTIVHSDDRLIASSKPAPSSRFYSLLNASIKKMGVKVILGEQVQIPLGGDNKRPFIAGTGTYQTNKGTSIDADLVLICIGAKVNSTMYPAAWKNERGQLKVMDTLQLINHPNIFAIGDCNDSKESKQAFFATFQAGTAVSNISKMMKKQLTQLKPYKIGLGTGKPFIIVPAGSKGGASYMGYMAFGGFVSSLIKGKTVFVPAQWGKYHMRGKDIPKEIAKNKDTTEQRLENLSEFYEK